MRLFLVSFVLLFTELVLIRWIPANVTYVGFFANFLLIGSFLGIGTGLLLGRRFNGDQWGRFPIGPFLPLLFLVALVVMRAQLNVQLRSSNEIFFGLAENRTAADINFLVLPLVVGLTTVLMATLALPLGSLLRAMPPLRAYTLDILGSLGGIGLFTLLSALSTPPPVWFAFLGALLAFLALGRGVNAWGALSVTLLVGTAIVAAPRLPAGVYEYWSPYYRITQFTHVDGTTVQALSVNGIPHQAIWDLRDPRKELFYEQVYEWLPARTFDEVLVVGAGNGVDVATALSHGAKHVDAVEIDPRIAEIGREFNPQQPYSDPRVSVHINDGRNFIATTKTQYDLVVFALPDSLTLVSTTANIRLETFLFTEEAFAAVRDRLSPSGVFVLYNYYRQPWLLDRLSGMLNDAFGVTPIVRGYRDVSATFAVGPGVANRAAIAGEWTTLAPDPDFRPATDDWPFLYLREPAIAPYYVAALVVIFLFGLVLIGGASRLTRTPIRRFSPHFFILGAAFLLLETRSIVTFSLLFGSTWLTNAMAFSAILLSVLASILFNSRFRLRSMRPFYLLLFALLLLDFLLPPEKLLIDPPILRYVLASILAVAPVFCANTIFTASFRDTRMADMSFASNLLGAVAGGALEYLSLLFGQGVLYLVGGGLYALAWLFSTRIRVLADVDLESSEGEPGELDLAVQPLLGGT